MSDDDLKNNVAVTAALENEEDDFSEFGGFEMADVPAAAAEAQPLPAALQVGPNPWLLMAVQQTAAEAQTHPTESDLLTSSQSLTYGAEVITPTTPNPSTHFVNPSTDRHWVNEIESTSASNLHALSPKQSVESAISRSLHPKSATSTDSATPFNNSFEAIQLEVMKHQMQEQATMFAQLRDQHAVQMQQLQQTSQNTVAIIAEQYKELSCASIKNCEAECRQQIKEFTEHEKVVHEQLLHSQQDLIRKTLDEEQVNLSAKLAQRLQEQRAEQQEQFDKFLQEEKEQMKLELSRALEEEADRNKKLFEDAIQVERDRTRQTLHDEREKMMQLIQEERDHSSKLLAEACEFERRQAKEAIEAAVSEQQSRIASLMEDTLKSARDQMKLYAEEQRQADRTSRLHVLSSVDLLLNTACQQLQKLKAPPDDL